MGITVEDIQKQGFEHALRGYDVEQVDDFLERVATEVGNMNQEIAALRQQNQELQTMQQEPQAADTQEQMSDEEIQALINEAAATASAEAEQRALHAEARVVQLEAEVSEKQDMDDTISAAFISAQRSADNLKEEARAEGERIYRESEAKAREFIREALVERQRIQDEIESLTASCTTFRGEYKKLLAHFAEEAETEFPDMPSTDVDESLVAASMPNMDDIDMSAVDAPASSPQEAADAQSAPSTATSQTYQPDQTFQAGQQGAPATPPVSSAAQSADPAQVDIDESDIDIDDIEEID